MNKIHAAYILITRAISKGLPKMQKITGAEAEYWKDVQRVVRRACIRSYLRNEHCRNPYPTNDLRWLTWQNTARRIARRQASRVIRKPDAWLIEQMTAELTGEPLVLPPAPEGKQLIHWGGEHVYI